MTRAVLSSAVALVLATAVRAEPPVAPANPLALEQAAALADARKLGAAAVGVRYLTVYNVAEARRGELRQALNYWVNSLSRTAEPVRLEYVTPTLLRLQIRKYLWDSATWDKLANEDPYFHVRIQLHPGQVDAKAYFPAGIGGEKAGWKAALPQSNIKVAAIAPWLPPEEAAELVALTQTAAPLVRGDWFASRVAIQEGRKGTGYYDWLKLTNRDDFDKLIVFDRKKSQAISREIAAIVRRSGVSRFPRQIFREQALTGGRWETRDVITDNEEARDALEQKDDDFKFEAQELYGFLPNGLFVYFLSNDKGVRQDSAPDGIGYHKGAAGNDGKIHIGLTCTACHVEGLRPIVDWARQVYRPPLKLTSPDPEKAERLQQLYLNELTHWVDDDIVVFAKALKKTNGLTPEANAKVIAHVWEEYVEGDVTPESAAAEFGIKEEEYLACLVADLKRNPLANSVISSHAAVVPVPIRRDSWERVAPLIYATILGTPGKGKP